jgi:hypothetical protein
MDDLRDDKALGFTISLMTVTEIVIILNKNSALKVISNDKMIIIGLHLNHDGITFQP